MIYDDKKIAFSMRILLLISVLLLSACASKYSSKYTKDNYGIEAAPNTYTIKRGDTLFSIAWRFGLEQKTIQRNNNIHNPNKIYIGQRLRLTSRSTNNRHTKPSRTATAMASKKPANKVSRKGNWVWPIKGKIIRRFNPKRIGANGIRIAGKANQTVNAADSGKVVYKGNGLNGYGNVVIIKHRNGLLSAYGFLSKTYVKEGQNIKKRQKIGTVGYAANNRLMLHFEIRRKGRPVNPMSYIGSRYHF